MNNHLQRFLSRIGNRQTKVGVIGLGYVGLPMALRFVEVGLSVTGFDIDPEKSRKLAAAESYINYIPSSRISEALAKGFRATGEFELLGDMDVVLICVPTPLNRHREPDLSFVVKTTETLARYARPGQLICLESTTYPGTTEEELLPRLEAGGLKVGSDLFLVFSPERQDPGNIRFHEANIPKLVGGCTTDCLTAGRAFYEIAIDKVVPVSSPRVAEMAKLLENIHRAVNIGLVNELKTVADKMGINIFEVIDAAATKPFGFVPYYPGPGLGGHCIPIDPFYLTWKAREYGIHTRFIELAGEINHSMPEYVIQKLTVALNTTGKAVHGAKVLLCGIAYKKNIDDLRESPALELLDRLENLGAEVDYSDPHIPKIPNLRRGAYDRSSVSIEESSIDKYDAVIIATDHSAFNFAMIADRARLVVDTRGVYRTAFPRLVRA